MEELYNICMPSISHLQTVIIFPSRGYTELIQNSEAL